MLIDFWIFQFYWSEELFLLIYESKRGGTHKYSILPVPGVFSQDVGAAEACVNSMDSEFEPSMVINNVLVRRAGKDAGIVSRAEFDQKVTKAVKIKLERGRLFLERDLATLSERIAGTIKKAEGANPWGMEVEVARDSS
jgi:hypothetical protein